MTQTESFTNSESLAPWKRGQVPAAHWPDFAADRVEAPPVLHSQLHPTSVREPSSELADNDRLALEAFESLDALDGTSLDDECELSDEDLVEDTSPSGDYIPALIDHTSGTFRRVVSKVLIPFAAVVILVIAMGGTWSTADATPAAAVVTAPTATHAIDDADHPRAKSSRKDLSGKLNLNTASEDQLMMLPTVGPSKADRIVAWRKKNGGFKRTADLRHVKGFGYKTFKKIEPFLDVKGDTTLVAK
jgi:competence ComEA-like helix-hairpin-helix protein